MQLVEKSIESNMRYIMDEKNETAKNIIASNPAFRAGEVVSIGLQNGLSKRTLDYAIEEELENGLITRVARGLYANNQFYEDNNDLALAHISSKYQANSVVSLYSSLYDLSKHRTGKLYAVVPSGKIGTLSTPMGDLEIKQVSSRLMRSITSEFGNERCFNVNSSHLKVHSPEMGVALASYLDSCGMRTSLSVDNLDNLITEKEVDWYMVSEMLESAGLSAEMQNNVRAVLERSEPNLDKDLNGQIYTSPSVSM